MPAAASISSYMQVAAGVVLWRGCGDYLAHKGVFVVADVENPIGIDGDPGWIVEGAKDGQTAIAAVILAVIPAIHGPI